MSERRARATFTRSAIVGSALGFAPFAFALTAGRPTLLRTARPDRLFSNVFDLQAMALLHGHFDVPAGSLAIESFNIGGRSYAYFPPFPALLRMPVLAVAGGLSGRLTAISMLLAWCLTMAALAGLLWHLRAAWLDRPSIERWECVSIAVFMAMVGGGSTLVYLASAPWVYHEVYAWSVALALVAALGVLRYLAEPSWRRAVDLGAALSALILTRTTVGAGGVLMAVVGALVLARTRRGTGSWRGIALAALVPTVLACLVTWVKFGSPFRFLPLDAQVWTQVNARRRLALAANHGGLTNLAYLPSTITAYFRPDGVRLRPYFPFVSLPAHPPTVLGNVVFDQTYRTGSATALMPGLVVLAVVGAVGTLRRMRVRSAAFVWIPMLGMGVAMLGVLDYGYMAHRYSGDLMPALVVCAAVGLTALHARTGRPRRQWMVVVGLSTICAWQVVANGAIAWTMLARTEESASMRRFVSRQLEWSPSRSLDGLVRHTSTLPPDAPADTLQIVGSCAASFVATGETNEPWMVLGGDTLRARIHPPAVPIPRVVPLVTFNGVGDERLDISLEFDGNGDVRAVTTGFYRRLGQWMALPGNGPFRLLIGLDQRATAWGVELDGQLLTLVESTRYDRDWRQHYVVPAAGRSSEIVEWRDPFHDRLCRRMLERLDP